MPTNKDENEGKQEKRTESEEREQTSESESLKEREYRGPDGEIHHHTKKYMEQHEGETGKEEE